MVSVSTKPKHPRNKYGRHSVVELRGGVRLHICSFDKIAEVTNAILDGKRLYVNLGADQVIINDINPADMFTSKNRDILSDFGVHKLKEHDPKKYQDLSKDANSKYRDVILGVLYFLKEHGVFDDNVRDDKIELVCNCWGAVQRSPVTAAAIYAVDWNLTVEEAIKKIKIAHPIAFQAPFGAQSDEKQVNYKEAAIEAVRTFRSPITVP